jgi:hypothetical protein
MENLSAAALDYARNGLPIMAAATTRTIEAHRAVRIHKAAVAAFYERFDSPTGDGFAAAKAALVAAEAEVVAAKKDEEATRIRMEALYGGPL